MVRFVLQTRAARAALGVCGVVIVGFVLLGRPVAAIAATSETSPRAAIASAHPAATAAGHEILARGGNVYDAAVAVTAALAVVEPYSSGLGGGGFYLLHRAHDGFETMVDARERAPLAANAKMYLDAEGRPRSRESLDGPLAAGIPGVPAALVHLASRYGSLNLKDSLAPAIRLARKGFLVTARYRRFTERRHAALAAAGNDSPFLHDGFVPDVGDRIRQPDLARTLDALATQGHDGFYGGTVAQALVRGVRAAGGIWTLDDLADYHVKERTPVRGRYRDTNVTSAALPSSGGVVLLEALGIGGDTVQGWSDHVDPAHRLIEAMRLSYYDRARYLGDPDFVRVNVSALLAATYLDSLRRLIGPRALASTRLPKIAPTPERDDTTHFSIIDRDGNRVAATLSINGPFGSGFVPPGTGVLLNNEMDDFAIAPGAENYYGLVGSAANAIAPGKRPLSSMSPTFLETPREIVVFGTPGGSRIITMVLLATLDVAGGEGGAADWVRRRRLHHQYLPDVVQYEAGAMSKRVLTGLQERGHTLREVAPYGNMQIVVYDKAAKRLDGASDPRGDGTTIVR